MTSDRTVADAIAAVRTGSVSSGDAELLVEEIDALRACVVDAVTYWDGGSNRQALLTKHHAVIARALASAP